MITPELLKLMGTEHAINALRAELSRDLAWLPDWIESELSIENQQITAAAENYNLDAADILALGDAYFESVTHTCAVLNVLNGDPGFGGEAEDLQEGLLILRRLKRADITTLDDLEVLLDEST